MGRRQRQHGYLRSLPRDDRGIKATQALLDPRGWHQARAQHLVCRACSANPQAPTRPAQAPAFRSQDSVLRQRGAAPSADQGGRDRERGGGQGDRTERGAGGQGPRGGGASAQAGGEGSKGGREAGQEAGGDGQEAEEEVGGREEEQER